MFKQLHIAEIKSPRHQTNQTESGQKVALCNIDLRTRTYG